MWIDFYCSTVLNIKKYHVDAAAAVNVSHWGEKFEASLLLHFQFSLIYFIGCYDYYAAFNNKTDSISC